MAEIKKFPYAVIFNGVLYPANTEIRVEEELKAEEHNAEKPKEQKKGKKGGAE